MRIRFKNYSTDWFDYMHVSKEEMKDVLDGTDWEVEKFIDADEGNKYIGIVEKAD